MVTGNILAGGAAETIESVASSDPAAGANVSVTVPAGEQWEVLGMHVQLVTDATAANRRMRLIVDDGTNVFAQVSAEPVQAASLTHDYSFLPGVPGYAAVRDNHVGVQLPERLILPAGYRVRTAVVNLQAGDNLGAARLIVRVLR